MQQLEFFPEDADTRRDREIIELKEMQDKQRKSYFARDSKLNKKIESLEYELHAIKLAICKGKFESLII